MTVAGVKVNTDPNGWSTWEVNGQVFSYHGATECLYMGTHRNNVHIGCCPDITWAVAESKKMAPKPSPR